jgi:hypothetical protein
MSGDVRKADTLSFLLHGGGAKINLGTVSSDLPSSFGGHTILYIVAEENPGDWMKNQATRNLFACLVFAVV